MLASYQVLCISCELSPQDISQQEQVLVVYICISYSTRNYPRKLFQLRCYRYRIDMGWEVRVLSVIVSIWVGGLSLSYRYWFGSYRYRIDTILLRDIVSVSDPFYVAAFFG